MIFHIWFDPSSNDVWMRSGHGVKSSFCGHMIADPEGKWAFFPYSVKLKKPKWYATRAEAEGAANTLLEHAMGLLGLPVDG